MTSRTRLPGAVKQERGMGIDAAAVLVGAMDGEPCFGDDLPQLAIIDLDFGKNGLAAGPAARRCACSGAGMLAARVVIQHHDLQLLAQDADRQLGFPAAGLYQPEVAFPLDWPHLPDFLKNRFKQAFHLLIWRAGIELRDRHFQRSLRRGEDGFEIRRGLTAGEELVYVDLGVGQERFGAFYVVRGAALQALGHVARADGGIHTEAVLQFLPGVLLFFPKR